MLQSEGLMNKVDLTQLFDTVFINIICNKVKPVLTVPP
jgi:hypothetical protein